MPRCVAILNRKGGTAKTATAHHLGGTLAKQGRRVLLVDCDAQFNLTSGLLGPDIAEALDPAETVAALIDESTGLPPAALVRPTAFENLALLPGSEAAEEFNEPSPWKLGMRQFLLRDALAEAGRDFDLVLIDCPPHVQFWAWSALVAADGVIVPLQPEDHASLGMKSMRRVIARVRAEANPDLALIGFLLTMFNKSLGVHVTYADYIRRQHGADVFETVVPLSKDFKEAVTFRKPIAHHKPRSAAAKVMDTLAEEFLGRLDARTAPTRRVA